MEQHHRKNWLLNTRLNHPQRVSPQDFNPSLLAPIYQSVKYVVSPDVSYQDQFIYGRVSNPTVRQLEMLLADIQQREDCIVLSSGLAAITGMLLGLLKAGDHIITFKELYKPGRIFIRDTLPRFGIRSSVISLNDTKALEESIIPGETKLIHFESPTNPNLMIADIESILKLARKHNILVSMDGTFAGLHQHHQFDIDIMVHSLTKFANGHGDVLAGSIAGKASLIKKIRHLTISLGASLDPHGAYLVERGLKTYSLRVSRHVQNAQTVANFLDNHPKIKKVFYPGLKKHEGHELAQKQMLDMGSVVSFILDETYFKDANEFIRRLNLIQFAVSLGSTESIICPTHLFFGDDLDSADKEQMGIGINSLRLSVGLEDEKDILADLAQALG
jgi:methionine-gamma-lyase